VDLYPEFPFIHFEAAMVHIARGNLERAESVLREGTIVQDRQADMKQRYPAKGLHWLLGLVRLARGDASESIREFECEIASGPSQLYAAEFAMNAHDGLGFAYLQAGDPEPAGVQFRRALDLFPEHARSLVGLGKALEAAGDPEAAAAAFDRADTAVEALRRGGRTSEAILAAALHHTVRGRQDDAFECLNGLLDRADLPFTGWTIPIEPLLSPLRDSVVFGSVLSRLAERAR
jgi:tetratricopeptide (TPR) repeat protein